MTEKEIKTITKINNAYKERELTKFDELTELNKKVKRPAKIFAYVFGTAGSLVLGTGMSLAMKVIGQSLSYAMPLGIGVGILGLISVSANYFIYERILKKRRKKYGEKVLSLSSELLQN